MLQANNRTEKELPLTMFVGALCATLIHCILIANGVYGISADESGRIYDTLVWLRTGTPYSSVWLPGYRILLAGAFSVWEDFFWTPRVLSFLFGMFTWGAGVWFAHEVWKNRTITGATALLLAVFPQRVLLSVVPLTEIVFCALILVALASSIRWLSTQNARFLVVSTLALALTTTLRYEGWGFALLFIIILVRERVRKKHPPWFVVLLNIAVVVVVPALWMVRNYTHFGTPFTFFETTIDINYNIPFLRQVWHNPLTQFFFINALTFNLLGIGTFLTWKNSFVKELLWVSLLLFSCTVLVGSTLPTHTPWRVTAVWGMALLPFTVAWFYDQCKCTSASRWFFLTTLIVMLCVQTVLLGKYYTSNDSSFTQDELRTAKDLEAILSSYPKESKVLIETSYWRYLHILIASHNPFRFVLNGAYRPQPRIEGMLALPCDSLQNVLKTHRIAAVVVESTGYKHQAKLCSLLERFSEHGKWTIFIVR
ncbi:MAG: hypothetical protein N3A63_03300 [Bacteroidetes bacterium]|nr:hypothetical protein [Bacteroidota bacterium]